MRPVTRLFVCGCLAVLSCHVAFAEEVALVQTAPAGAATFSLFAGTAVGYSTIRGENFDGLGRGRSLSLFGLLSPRWNRWQMDVGLGWQQTRFRGHTDQSEVFDMITQSAHFDLNPSWCFGEHWQVGPLVSVVFGADQRYGIASEDANGLAMWGPRVAYEWRPEEIWWIRAFGQVLWETTIKERQLTSASVGLMVGLPIGRGPASSLARNTAPRSDVAVTLDPELIFFKTASTGIRPEARNRLQSVAKALRDEGIECEAIDVIGHADQRGPRPYNLRLSERRAREVSDQLQAAGIEQAQLRVHYFGKNRLRDPANTPKAWALNRRVEVIFRGVKDPKRLRAVLLPLKELEPEVGR